MATLLGHSAGGEWKRCHDERKWTGNNNTNRMNDESRKGEMIILPLKRDGMIQFDSNISKTGKMKLFNDTGADRSVVLKEKVKEGRMEKGTRTLLDLSGNEIDTQGKIMVDMTAVNTQFEQEFQVLNSLGRLNADGILGKDFLWGRAIIDMINGTLAIKKDKINEVNCKEGNYVVNVINEDKRFEMESNETMTNFKEVMNDENVMENIGGILKDIVITQEQEEIAKVNNYHEESPKKPYIENIYEDDTERESEIQIEANGTTTNNLRFNDSSSIQYFTTLCEDEVTYDNVVKVKDPETIYGNECQVYDNTNIISLTALQLQKSRKKRY